jgi:hypothetical protein
MRRRALCLTLAAVVTATACRPTQAEEQAAERVVLSNVSRALRYIAATHPQGGNLSEVAAGLASLVDNALAIKPKLDKIAASEEPFGEALVIATCYGLSHIARQAEETQGPILPPPARSGSAFLLKSSQFCYGARRPMPSALASSSSTTPLSLQRSTHIPRTSTFNSAPSAVNSRFLAWAALRCPDPFVAPTGAR